MPPAAAAAAPSALGWAGIGLGGASLLDNLFGSGREARDQQGRALDLQEQLANAQLPDIERRTALNQFLEDMLKDRMANPQQPSSYVDLESGLSQYGLGKPLIPQELYSELGPGAMSGIALRELMGLGGNVGTGGVPGFANLATGIGESRRGEFKENIEDIVRVLLQNRQQPQQSAVNPGGMSDPFGSFFSFTGR